MHTWSLPVSRFGQRSALGHLQPLKVPRNPRYTVDVTRQAWRVHVTCAQHYLQPQFAAARGMWQVTLEKIATTYNNYYEFGMSKDISQVPPTGMTASVERYATRLVHCTR